MASASGSSFTPRGAFTSTLKSDVDKDNILSVTTTFSPGASSRLMLAAKARAREAEGSKGTKKDAAQSAAVDSERKSSLSGNKDKDKDGRRIRFSDLDVVPTSRLSVTKPGTSRAKQSAKIVKKNKHSAGKRDSKGKSITEKQRPEVLKDFSESETEKQETPGPSQASEDEIKNIPPPTKAPRPSKAVEDNAKMRPSKVPDDAGQSEEAGKRTTITNISVKPDVTDDDDEVKPDAAVSKKVEKKDVIVQVIFYRFRDVNTSAETFDAEVILNTRWPVPEFDNSKKLPDRVIDEDEYSWRPELSIENSIRDMKTISRSVTLQYATSGKAFVAQSTKYFGKFSEPMELRDFPFDIQRLTLLIRTERPLSEVRLVHTSKAPHLVRKSLYFQEQQFRLYMHVVTKELNTDPYGEYDRGPEKTSDEMRVGCVMARNPVFYINNCYLIALMLFVLGFVSFAPDVQFTMQRNVLSFFVTLAAFNHKYTLVAHIPKTSYLTHADRYCLTVIVCLLLMSVWQAIMTVLDVETRKRLDAIGVAVFGAIFLLFNIGIWTTILYRTINTRRRLDETEIRYIAKLKKLKDEKNAIDNDILE